MARSSVVLVVWAAALVWGQTDPAQTAYHALRQRDYEAGISYLTDATRAAPGRAALRKDLAYAYLKIGETEAARDQFAEAIRLDPADLRIELEYAFLCHETRRTAEARRTFARLRTAADAEIRATAGRAFENIDGPLAAGIARWSEVVKRTPDDYSARHELARLAEQRDERELAAENYLAAWRLRPADRGLLVDLGRMRQALGQGEAAAAALLVALRGGSPRAAEAARELLPARTPYESEYRAALALDPVNAELRRDLAYLLLALKREDEAEAEFRAILRSAPADAPAAAQLGLMRLGRGDRLGATPFFDVVFQSGDDDLMEAVRAALKLPPGLRRRIAARPEDSVDRGVPDAREMGERSYRAGYLKDALIYFEAAHEADPGDTLVMLRLGQTHNLLRRDDNAIGWFRRASRSPDAAIAKEAGQAYRNLRPQWARFRTTFWMFPFYSSRWKDVFSYAQVKTELRLGKLPFRPYISVRFNGDARRTTGEAVPQYLSESAFILGLGVATRPWRGLTLWAEAGETAGYLSRRNEGRFLPDYRGGFAYARGWGQTLGGESSGWYAESFNDGVFVSRFQNDFLIYSQNRVGYTLPELGGFRAQVYANLNATVDTERQYWANTAEAGPGVRFRWRGLPQSLVFSVNLVRGVYLRNEYNPRRPNFFDLRAGFWYAFTR
jgi:Tfp pilus assembly protein PilF